MRKLIPLLFVSVALSVCAQTKPAHPEMLVSTDWLAQHLDDPKLVILEFPKDKETYAAGHIPGARAIYGELIYGERNGVESELLPVNELVNNFEALGISNDSRVVIYTTGWPPMATRVYFTLDYLGLGDHASVLDGGFNKWKKEGRKVSTETPVVKAGKITPTVRPEIVSPVVGVLAWLTLNAKSPEQPVGAIVDTRPEKRYAAGHIPGAVNLYWQKTVQSDNPYEFLPVTELSQLYSSTLGKHQLITYCEIGWQASHGYFTAKYLGYDVKMYDGSFNEWNDVKHEPVVKGNSPR